MTVGGAAKETQSFAVSNGLMTSIDVDLDGPTAGAEWQADGAHIDDQEPSVALVTDQPDVETRVLVRNHTASNIVITLANGTSGQNQVITCTNFVPEGAANVPFSVGQKVGYANEYIAGSGTNSGRILVTAS